MELGIKVVRVSYDNRNNKTLEEIKSFFSTQLYLWTVVFVSLLIISYHDYFVLFALTI